LPSTRRCAACTCYLAAFQLAVTWPEAVFNETLMPRLRSHTDGRLADAMVAETRRRLGASATHAVKAVVELRCIGSAGVHAVRRALLHGVVAHGLTHGVAITCKLVTPPLYALRCSTTDQAAGVATLLGAIEAGDSLMSQHAGGGLTVKEASRAADEHDGGAELAARLAGVGQLADELDGATA